MQNKMVNHHPTFVSYSQTISLAFDLIYLLFMFPTVNNRFSIHIIFFLRGLGMELRSSRILSKCPSTELCHNTLNTFHRLVIIV